MTSFPDFWFEHHFVDVALVLHFLLFFVFQFSRD